MYSNSEALAQSTIACLEKTPVGVKPTYIGLQPISHREWLWTFVDVREIEPTNNAAERALRPAVIYRMLSFGTQSEAWTRFVERMLTMSETCRLQGRSIFGYLVSAVEAHFAHHPAPSLLPGCERLRKFSPVLPSAKIYPSPVIPVSPISTLPPRTFQIFLPHKSPEVNSLLGSAEGIGMYLFSSVGGEDVIRRYVKPIICKGKIVLYRTG